MIIQSLVTKCKYLSCLPVLCGAQDDEIFRVSAQEGGVLNVCSLLYQKSEKK
jgi:hypothetical protein